MARGASWWQGARNARTAASVSPASVHVPGVGLIADVSGLRASRASGSMHQKGDQTVARRDGLRRVRRDEPADARRPGTPQLRWRARRDALQRGQKHLIYLLLWRDALPAPLPHSPHIFAHGKAGTRVPIRSDATLPQPALGAIGVVAPRMTPPRVTREAMMGPASAIRAILPMTSSSQCVACVAAPTNHTHTCTSSSFPLAAKHPARTTPSSCAPHPRTTPLLSPSRPSTPHEPHHFTKYSSFRRRHRPTRFSFPSDAHLADAKGRTAVRRHPLSHALQDLWPPRP